MLILMWKELKKSVKQALDYIDGGHFAGNSQSVKREGHRYVDLEEGYIF